MRLLIVACRLTPRVSYRLNLWKFSRLNIQLTYTRKQTHRRMHKVCPLDPLYRRRNFLNTSSRRRGLLCFFEQQRFTRHFSPFRLNLVDNSWKSCSTHSETCINRFSWKSRARFLPRKQKPTSTIHPHDRYDRTRIDFKPLRSWDLLKWFSMKPISFRWSVDSKHGMLPHWSIYYDLRSAAIQFRVPHIEKTPKKAFSRKMNFYVFFQPGSR